MLKDPRWNLCRDAALLENLESLLPLVILDIALGAEEEALAGEKYLNDKYTTLIRQGAALGLSAREREITALVKRSLSNETIAEKMNISVRTVQNHLAHIYVKTNTHSRNELARL
jgi:NarL family two-component system response regulator LiaR